MEDAKVASLYIIQNEHTKTNLLARGKRDVKSLFG